MTDITAALKELREERGRLDKAITTLERLHLVNGAGAKGRTAKRPTMSAAARRRIVAAQRARWAKWRREQKKAA